MRRSISNREKELFDRHRRWYTVKPGEEDPAGRDEQSRRIMKTAYLMGVRFGAAGGQKGRQVGVFCNGTELNLLLEELGKGYTAEEARRLQAMMFRRTMYRGTGRKL